MDTLHAISTEQRTTGERAGTQDNRGDVFEDDADLVLEGRVGAFVEVLGEFDECLIEAVKTALAGP